MNSLPSTEALDQLNYYIKVAHEIFPEVGGQQPDFTNTSRAILGVSDPSKGWTNDQQKMMRKLLAALFFNGRPRVSYQFPNEVIRDICDQQTNTYDLPSEVLRLPYDAVFFANYNKETHTHRECFIFQRPNPNGRALMFVRPDSLITITLFDGLTVRESIKKMMELAPEIMQSRGDLSKEIECGERTLNWMVNAILYLTGGDVIESRIPEKTGKKARNLKSWEKSVSIRGVVGGRFVSAVRAYEAKEHDYYTATGGHLRPHSRRAHWHIYWTGKGRTTPRAIWVDQCLVNADSIGPDVEIQRTVKS